ncbi:DNA replication licensing factor mcm5, putative [Pediculus humanus corporis]|uniref:DNA replication licensing factor MCM5 n=1 Tax=Pediculus humanus subsp. corporis TaxID=121224 RepID=E0VYG5_PEDHC|nr:DNA replication licensing factor mcm5, putative [Pediculus humanus corporis]EEB18421.1 DNA replication licensing factor mcm5, putative [Pediculus humanus corporis]
MEGFDDGGIFFSQNFTGDNKEGVTLSFKAIKQSFKDFLRKFHEGNFNYKYRDALKRNYGLGNYSLEINLQDLSSFDENLAEKLYKQPAEHLPVFEEATKEVADEITHPRPEGEEIVKDVQVLLTSDDNPVVLRNMKSEMISKLVKVSGIIVSASGIRSKATKMSIQCRGCLTVVPNIAIKLGLDGFALPRKCSRGLGADKQCPLDPYFILPDKCSCVDFQTLKMQELPDDLPQGEMPRHLQLYVDRQLCDKVVPGNRVIITGIYSIKKVVTKAKKGEKFVVGIRHPYIRVVGIQVCDSGTGLSKFLNVTRDEEEEFRRLAASDVYEKVTKSIAPSIFGFNEIKKAMACLLFGGSRKRLPDGLIRRGDVNILLLGDPGTAKSQLLKFVEKVAPIGVYTSGKGSSAAGLTASVSRDAATRNFVMEGGALVLADGGVVCIDEFDKMREDDRVAIHEAMEQQTISIAKAGITTTLNSRCSILAAANSVFGRWDETKGEENIDFMPTILSRFDMIFIVKDEHNAEKDITLATHIMNIHMTGGKSKETTVAGEMPINLLKKYIHYCRTHCGPRLSEAAGEKLKHRYVLMRGGAKEHEMQTDKKNSIPITVRQLEAIIRMSESLAKMQLLPFATEVHVEEALRLFQVSTLDAAMSGSLSGAEGFTTQEDHEMLIRIEKNLKRRFAVGTQISINTIIQSFTQYKYPEAAVQKVIYAMIRRGELQHRFQRKMLFRVS